MNHVYETKQKKLGHVCYMQINKKIYLQKLMPNNILPVWYFCRTKSWATSSSTFIQIMNKDSFQYLKIILGLIESRVSAIIIINMQAPRPIELSIFSIHPTIVYYKCTFWLATQPLSIPWIVIDDGSRKSKGKQYGCCDKLASCRGFWRIFVIIYKQFWAYRVYTKTRS